MGLSAVIYQKYCGLGDHWEQEYYCVYEGGFEL